LQARENESAAEANSQVGNCFLCKEQMLEGQQFTVNSELIIINKGESLEKFLAMSCYGECDPLTSQADY